MKERPLYPSKQTLLSVVSMSAKCKFQTKCVAARSVSLFDDLVSAPVYAFGTMRPSALAVLRLITNSYLAGAYIECDFKIPSRIGEVIDLTLLVEDIGRSSLAIAIVCHRDNIERLRARMVTAMMSLETKKAVPMPHGLREAIDSYRRRTGAGAN